MNNNNRKHGVFSSITNMDITLKFSSAIIIGLVVLFALASIVLLNQQTTALDNMLSASKDIETKAMDKQTTAAKVTVRKNAQQLVNLLKHTVPIPMAEFDIGTLQRYAQVVHEDSQISYVSFLNTEGKTFASQGDKSKVNPDNVIKGKVEAEGLYLGDVVVAYNLNDFEQRLADIRDENAKNLQIMTKAKDSALSTAKISFSVIILVVALCIAAMIYFMFKFIVIDRLRSLELRLKDIAEGEGDLTQRVLVQGNDSIDRVGLYFNGFLDTVHDTMKQVASAVSNLSSRSEAMGNMTNENQRDILLQKEQVDQAATAITQMSASIREVAQNTSLAAESAQQADEEAQSGNQVVSNTVQAINTLADVVDKATEVIHKVESDSVSIGTILDVIRGIAEQTNLLALNAAIEAARAGEQGRGFAVVADEVRTLAQRTQESTQEIQQMIEQLQQGTSDAVGVMEQGRNQVQASVDIAGKAGESLRVITASVSQIMDMNTQIAGAAEEQNSVSEEINKNIISIRTVSDKAADVAQQTLESSEELSQLSFDLQSLVGKFRI
jgi:methyl-accepting chemotaxis protein